MTEPLTPAVVPASAPPLSPGKLAVRRFARHRLAVGGLVVLGALFSGAATIVESAALAALYEDILACIESRGYDYSLGRVSLSGRRKAALMAGSIGRALVTRPR